MHLKKISLLFFLLINCLVQAQNQTDEAPHWQTIKTAPDDSVKVNALNKVVKTFIKTKPDSVLALINSSIELAKKINYVKGLNIAYGFKGDLMQKQGKYSEALDFYKKGLGLSQKINDQREVAMNYFKIALMKALAGSIDSAMLNNQMAIEAAKIIDYKEVQSMAYSSLGWLYTQQGDIDKALIVQKKALAISKSLGNGIENADLYCDIGVTHQRIGKLDKALAFYQKSLKIYQQLKDRRGIGRIFYYMGNANKQKGQYNKALATYNKALIIAKERKSLLDIVMNLDEIGDVCRREGKYKEALRYHHESRDSLKTSILHRQKAKNLYYLGLVYSSQKEYERALEYFEKSLNIEEALKMRADIADINTAIGNVYQALNKCEQAIPYYEAVLNFRLTSKLGEHKGKIYLHLGKCYADLGYLNKARLSAEKAFASEVVPEQIKAANLLMKIYEQQNNMEQAYRYSVKHNSLKDSLIKIENRQGLEKALKEMEIANELERVSVEQQLKEEQLQTQQYFIWALASFGIASVFVGLFLYLYYRKSKEVAEKELAFRQSSQNLFANISHEFRTPLTIIKTPIEDLAAGTFKGNLNAISFTMLKSVNRLLDLVNQMLELSRLQEGKFKLNLTLTNVNTFLKDYISMFESMIASKQLKFSLTLPKESTSLYIDKEVFAKILNNLISNAAKFTEKGAIKVTVKYQEHGISLIVQDTGKGIPNEELAAIFNRYYQNPLHKIRTSTGGLGLNLTQQLVHFYGGSISVQSQENKGSIFSVLLPYHKKLRPKIFNSANITIDYTQTSTEQIRKHQQSPSIQHQINQLNTNLPKILVVEDNPDLQALFQHKLGNSYRIFQAFNGVNALKMIEKICPHLIITDIMMPTMDGISMIKNIRTNDAIKHIPILVVSALENDVKYNTIFEIGVIDFITKPIDFQILHFKIRNILQSRQQFKQYIQGNGSLNIISKNATLLTKDMAFLKQLKEVITNHRNKNLGVEQLSSMMAMSRSQLFKRIKELTGMSPSRFITKAKLEYAYELLQDKKGNVSEVLFEAGFTNASSFARQFKEAYGISPRKLLSQNYRNVD